MYSPAEIERVRPSSQVREEVIVMAAGEATRVPPARRVATALAGVMSSRIGATAKE